MSQLVSNKPSRKGRGQGYVANSKILHAIKYLWNGSSYSRQILCGCRLYQVLALIGQLTVPERGMLKVTWPSLEFYSSQNIFGAKATDFKFCARFATRSTNLQMINFSLSGRGQSHVMHSRISYPLK